MMDQLPSSLPPVPQALRELAGNPPRATAKGAALHLSRLALHLRCSQAVMLHKCAGPQGSDYSRLLADYDTGVVHLRQLLTTLRELRRNKEPVGLPPEGTDPWFYPPYQPFLRAVDAAINQHLPPVFEAIKRHRAVLKGQPYQSPKAA